jgi:hypothetical protein
MRVSIRTLPPSLQPAERVLLVRDDVDEHADAPHPLNSTPASPDSHGSN